MAIPVTGCEMLRITQCLDIRLTDGGGVVSLTHLQGFTPRNIIFLLLVLISVKRLSKPQGLVLLEGLGKLKKFNDLISNGTRDLWPCSIAPQPLRYRVSLDVIQYILKTGAEFVRKDCTTLTQLETYYWCLSSGNISFRFRTLTTRRVRP
jgi:hypothetical protein